MKKFSSFITKTLLLSFFALTIAPVLTLAISSDAKAQTPSFSTVSAGASSTDQNALSNTMCNAMKIVTGNAGKAFAAFAIISLGIGFFTGKISWGLMIGVSMGIAAMFGAPTIVAALSGKDAVNCG